MAKEKDKFDDKECKLCTSVFKSGGSIATKEIYTQKWIEVINTLERRKNVNLCENQ